MFGRIAKLFGKGSDLPPAPDHTIYAIGDIHGRRDLLEHLVTLIADDAPEGAELIFVGDYIDRGRESAGVIEFLLTDPALGPFDCTFLKGNHEQTMMQFLEDASVGPAWSQFGGLDTVASYGVRPPASPAANDPEWERVRTELAAAVPDSHRRFLSGLKLGVERGCYLFVHAGVDPNRPLTEQTEQELLWVRDAFLNDDRDLERIIVHGHTPAPDPVWDHRRIGLDTGAYASGRLTAARIDGEQVRFIST